MKHHRKETLLQERCKIVYPQDEKRTDLKVVRP